ncbi:RNA pseudouridine synthase 3, mitochondrial-like [Solanum pennellii]|uniref:RNA pseudouridine synthase 3, mitochondrial-like n=1 Tax=Solanum pennellii TaxID=28526 RepID=A0ABM1VHU2_SOLPN|nr:RNA pseudouridine synthase 3, mitochondrial-like [Solanum pennellii]
MLLRNLRVHCVEALETPIVGEYKYSGFVYRKWKQMPRGDIEPTIGKTYRLERPGGLAVQKGNVLLKSLYYICIVGSLFS